MLWLLGAALIVAFTAQVMRWNREERELLGFGVDSPHLVYAAQNEPRGPHKQVLKLLFTRRRARWVELCGLHQTSNGFCCVFLTCQSDTWPDTYTY